MSFKKAIIWGHPLHSHTHSYIHYAFAKTFKHMGYETHWLNDNDDISGIDFSNSIFITEGQVDKKMPLRDDCFYVLHNCYDEKYQNVKNKCSLQVYTDDVLKYNCEKIEDCHYADYNGKCLYQPWATDLLPHEIENNKPKNVFNKYSRVINWIGTKGGGEFGNNEQLDPFIKAAKDNGISFRDGMNVSMEDNIKLIKESYMAPTIIGKWQHEKNYLPCRIFKNISYGQLGLTNCRKLYELFQGKIVHNDNTEQLFYDARAKFSQTSVKELHDLMDFVSNKHTYINRINSILNFVDKVR